MTSTAAPRTRSPSARPGDDPSRDVDTDDRPVLVAMVLLTVLGLVLRLTFFNGPVSSDDTRYFESAELLVRGGAITVRDHATSRLAFLLLVGAPGAIAGSIFLAGIANVLISVATQVVASVFAYREIGPRAGLAVTIVLVFDGLALAYSGILMPDSLLALLTLVCGIMLYRAAGAPPTSALASFAWAGVAAGAAYSAKDTGILLLVPAAAWSLWQTDRTLRTRVSYGAAFGAGFVAVWLAEGMFFLARAGDFFYKVDALSEKHNAGASVAHGVVEFVRRGWWNLEDVSHSVWLSAVPLAVGAVCWLVLLQSRRRTAVFALIGGFVTAYLFFGTSSFSRFVNLPYQERYLLPVIPCVAIALGDVLERWRGGARLAWLAVLGAACFVGGSVGAARRSGRLYFSEGLRNAAIAVAALPNDGRPVLTARQFRLSLSHYLPHALAARVYDHTDYPPGTPGYYLVVLRGGIPAVSDTISKPGALGTPYLSVALDQRRAALWSSGGWEEKDSVVVYPMSAR
jgi:hypothetical protein